MKRVAFALLILHYLSAFLYPQSGWFWQNPLPQGNTLTSVKFVNTFTGVAVGERGTLLLSTNGGMNWNLLPSISQSKLNSVCILDSNTLIAVGNSGVIFKTTNRGVNWFSLNSGVGNSLSSVTFVNPQTGYAGGQSIVLKTTNGGTNWSPTPGSVSNVYAIHFINENTGWITTAYAVPPTVMNQLYRTTNGGMNWNYQLGGTYTTVLFTSVFFTNVNTGWCVPNFKTTNGGVNWFMQDPWGSFVYFLDDNIGWKIGTYSSSDTIYRTTNGGNNWLPRSDNILTALKSLHLINSQIGWGVGQYGGIAKTVSGGENWFPVSSGFYNEMYSVSYVDSNMGWTGGSNGTILRTTNSGGNWYAHFVGNNSVINQVYFATRLVGFAAIENCAVRKSTDGGVNWFVIDTFTNYRPRSVYFINENTGWIGTLLVVKKTTNGGLNWTNTAINNMYWTTGFFFVDSLTGWATGFSIAKTTNTGTSWFLQYSGSVGDFRSPFFVSRNTGWCIYNRNWGEGGIFKTTNGGNNWTEILHLASTQLNDLYFIDSSKGIVVGRSYSGGMRDLIMKTYDGGYNWYQLPPISNELIWNSVRFVSRQVGWVVGTGGAIMKTTNFGGDPLGVEEQLDGVPVNYTLFQNFPNPFNSVTKIKYRIPRNEYVTLRIYDIIGSEVSVIVNEFKKAGTYEVAFDGNNFASGVYLYRFEAGDVIQSKKMILIK